MVSLARCTSCHMTRRLISTNLARLETDRKHTDVSYPRPTCVTQHIYNNNGKGMSRNVALTWGEYSAFAFLFLLLKVAYRRQPEWLVFMTVSEGHIWRTSSTKNRKGSDAETALAVARTTVQNTVKLILAYDQHIYSPPHSTISCSSLSPVEFNAVSNSHGLTFSPLPIFFVWIFYFKAIWLFCTLWLRL